MRGAEERERWFHGERFRRDSRLVAPNIVIKNLPFQDNEDPKSTHDKVMNRGHHLKNLISQELPMQPASSM